IADPGDLRPGYVLKIVDLRHKAGGPFLSIGFYSASIARSRSMITTTLPGAPLPDFSDCSPALIAPTVLSIVLPRFGTTSPCTAHSIARVMPRWRKALASSSRVVGSEK